MFSQGTGQTHRHDRRSGREQVGHLGTRDNRHLGVGVEHAEGVGPFGPDHTDGDTAVLQGDGVGQVFGVDRGAGVGDVAVNPGQVDTGERVEGRADVSPLPFNLMATAAPGGFGEEDLAAFRGVAAERSNGGVGTTADVGVARGAQGSRNESRPIVVV